MAQNENTPVNQEKSGIIGFLSGVKSELKKVVWPTRQETMQTTLIVLAVSIVMALVLWGIDGIMVRLVALATGV